MKFFTELWNFILISSPYLLLGLFVAGLVHAFLTTEKIKQLLGNDSIKDVFLAALLGVPLPLCSCSVIPTAVTLKKSGASNGATSAFLIATPESGIDSVAVTYALMDLPMAIFRPVAAFFSAMVAGLLNNSFNDFELEDTGPGKKSCCSKNKSVPVKTTVLEKLKIGLKYSFQDLIEDISFWLMIGLVSGALISFFVPEDFFMHLSGWQNRLMILVVGIPLYICASATTPIAAAMVLKGLSPGAALLLLLVGPATNISNIAVLQQYIGKKGIIINIFSIVVVALIFSYMTDYFYANYSVVNFKLAIEHQHDEISWPNQISAVLISFMILKGIFKNKIQPILLKKKQKSCCDEK
jgi:uncharacterized protein